METTSDARVFQLVLTDELPRPVILTSDEIVGGWREVYPDLAACLPTPYPIFGRDEETVVTYGYPVLQSDGARKVRSGLDNLVNAEVQYRLASLHHQTTDKSDVMAERDRIHRSLSLILENVFMNDYGRGMTEVFLLFLSSQVVASVAQVPKLVRMTDRKSDNTVGVRLRYEIAEVVGDLIQRAGRDASDRLRKLAQVRLAPRISPLIGMIGSDLLMLSESRPTTQMDSLDGYLNSRFHYSLAALNAALDRAIRRLSQIMARQKTLGDLLASAAGTNVDLTNPWMLLEPRLLKALNTAGLLDSIGFSQTQATLCRDIGLGLKRFELLSAFRRRIVTMVRRGDQLVFDEPSARGHIAPTTRPFDFTSPGVVDTSVRRFGLIYDLTSFTSILEDVRRKGRVAEEKALQFMYVFQNRLEEIRHDHRLIFEKFLGDGGFYSSRRALRVLGAACEIQQAYDRLRRSGFPFDQGMRIALNHGVYRLLPMLDSDREIRRFEFFGHGIVELSRLTTGKSTREVADIAEFLIHAGYESSKVESFLAPIAEARSADRSSENRPYAAALDGHGELVNEGMVLTLEFVKHLEQELEVSSFTEVTESDCRWLLFPLDPNRPNPFQVGLRYLGVARLKGLAPIELVEAAVWTEIPAEAQVVSDEPSLIALLRRLGQSSDESKVVDDSAQSVINEDLVVLSHLEFDGSRSWIFGQYSAGEDVLLQAIRLPLQIPVVADGDQIETWLFRNRFELARLYQGVRRTDGGMTMPLPPLRQRTGYVACFLAAPHKAP